MSVDWYRADGRPATSDEAQRLLLDVRSRLLAQDVIHIGTVTVVISTWFTVTELGFAANGKPLLWQTIASDHSTHADIGQYTTREKAVRGHSEAVGLITDRLHRLVLRAADDVTGVKSSDRAEPGRDVIMSRQEGEI